ncbi:MAG: FAD-binding oxidoreductase [Chloroflexi bacterium]|nr:FAD-binding oxidoreductase [Chloroflexota bacterium]MDA1146366.1 FAD-binding oxidoreductase [Chloroflexota bacterium]
MTNASVANLDGLRAALPPDVQRAPEGYALDGVTPALAVRPRSAAELAATLLAADQAGLAVSPQGGRTAITLGRPLARYDVALDTTALDRVVEYAPEDLTITVEAGMTLAALQATLAAEGQYLPIDPSPGDQLTIGGLLATARSGAWRGHLPAARDLVLGAKVALCDGALTSSGGRVVKNVSGFDMHRMHTGALGALGVIVQASFKLAPLPAETATLALDCGSLANAGTIAHALWDRNLSARAITILDPEAASAVGLRRSPAVLVDFAGGETVVERCVRSAGEVARAHAAIVERVDPEAWTRLRTLARGGTDGTVVRLGVPASDVATLVGQAAAMMGPAWGHIAAGAVWARPAADARALAELRATAEARGGYLQVEAASRSLREAFDPFGSGDAELVRSLKYQFDPNGTLNPGRWGAGEQS